MQEGDLAEVVARPERTRLGARNVDLQLAAGDDVEAVADLANADDRGRRLHGHALEPRRERLQRRLRQPRKERDAPQEIELAARRRSEPGQPPPRRQGDDREDEARDDERELSRVNSAIVARMAARGEGMISSTRLGGRYALRLCVLNHSSGPDDVEAHAAALAGR